jgi:hypothetical protein
MRAAKYLLTAIKYSTYGNADCQIFANNEKIQYLRECGLPTADGHLGVSRAGHGTLIDVGTANNDVGVVNDDHLAVHVDHLQKDKLIKFSQN